MSNNKPTLLDFKPNFTLEDGISFKMKNYLTPFMVFWKWKQSIRTCFKNLTQK